MFGWAYDDTLALVAGLIRPQYAWVREFARSSIAVTIIGGQLLCLLLTLLVVPVAYSYVEDARDWFARRRHSGVPVQAPAVGD